VARLTRRQIEWWNAQPDAQTCADCGKQGTKAYVQPQQNMNGAALCVDCIARRNETWRQNRRAQLAAAPRCEVPGCERRGAWHVGAGRVLMCGAHRRRAHLGFHRANSGNPFALFMPPPSDRASVLAWAQEAEQ
jgi:NMD protein affecting ribosome stability and mRNA decay